MLAAMWVPAPAFPSTRTRGSLYIVAFTLFFIISQHKATAATPPVFSATYHRHRRGLGRPRQWGGGGGWGDGATGWGDGFGPTGGWGNGGDFTGVFPTTDGETTSAVSNPSTTSDNPPPSTTAAPPATSKAAPPSTSQAPPSSPTSASAPQSASSPSSSSSTADDSGNSPSSVSNPSSTAFDSVSNLASSAGSTPSAGGSESATTGVSILPSDGSTSAGLSGSSPASASSTSSTSNSAAPSGAGDAVGAVGTSPRMSSKDIAGVTIAASCLLIFLVLGYVLWRRIGGTRRYRRYRGNDLVPFMAHGATDATSSSPSPYTPSGFMGEKFVRVRETGNSGIHPGARTIRRNERAALMQRLADRIRERDELQLQRTASRPDVHPDEVIAITASATLSPHHSHKPSNTNSANTLTSPADPDTISGTARATLGVPPDWRDVHIEQQDVHINQLSLEVAQLQAVLARYENEPSEVPDEVLPEYESESGSGHHVRV